MDVNLMEHMRGRKYFHPGRRPQAHFTIGEQLYTAVVYAYVDDGVVLICKHAQDLKPSQLLTRMHLTKYGRTCQTPDLCVSSVAAMPSGVRIEARTADSALAEQLFQTLVNIENPDHDIDSLKIDPSAIPRISRKRHYTQEAILKRSNWIEQVSGIQLGHLMQNSLKPETLAGNIENYIGAIQIPVGITGPVLIRGVYTHGYIPIPIATTEGALVSSICRGAAVCNEAGGVQVHIQRQTMSRAPVFFCRDMDGAINLEHWLHDDLDTLKVQAESVSAVARLQEIRTHVFDNTLHVQFFYTTGDASGQNMTSACTWMACRWIKEQVAHNKLIGLQNYMIEGNMSGDKKANHQNFTLGRGVAVTATCRIPGAILKKRLRITPDEYYQ
jgi:hypothetical protein